MSRKERSTIRCASHRFRRLGLSVACSLAFFPLYANDIKLKECPDAVRKTIEQNLLGGKLDDIKEIRISDHVLYLVEIDLKGFRDARLYIAGDGTLRKIAEEIKPRDLPEPVRQSLERHAIRQGKIDDVVKVTVEGKVSYEIDIDQPKGPDRTIVFEADGSISWEK